MKRFLICVAFLAVPGCSTPSPLSSLPLFSGMGPSPDDARTSRSAMSGLDGPTTTGPKTKPPLSW